MTKRVRFSHQITVLVLSLSFLLAACERHSESDTADRLEIIQQKIDHEQYAEAINELDEILKKEPHHDRARTILASVYVHRAGISIQDYFFLVSLAQLDEKPKTQAIDVQSLKRLAGNHAENIQSLTNFLQKLNEAASVGDQIVNKFESIPVLSSKSAQDIKLALETLEKLKTPTAGMVFYRGVLKLYYFKFLWSKGSLLPLGQGKLCSSSLGEIGKKLKVLNDYSVRMILDIAKGFPNETKGFIDQASQLDNQIRMAVSHLQRSGAQEQNLKNYIQSQLNDLGVRNFPCDF